MGSIHASQDRSNFSCVKYKFMLDSPYEFSNRCCSVMKKGPAHAYNKETGRRPIIATMASESRIRKQKWLQNGCNGFDMKEPVSNPISFWTEQDVLEYIRRNDIKIAPPYGDVVLYIGDNGSSELTTTGCKRTGCMFCGFGVHMKDDDRFVRMKETHPAQYEWIMKPWDRGGLGYKDVIDWLNEHGNLHIKY